MILTQNKQVSAALCRRRQLKVKESTLAHSLCVPRGGATADKEYYVVSKKPLRAAQR